MKDDRTVRLLHLVAIAERPGQSPFPGGRPALLTWLGQQLDDHPGDAGHHLVEQRLRQRLTWQKTGPN